MNRNSKRRNRSALRVLVATRYRPQSTCATLTSPVVRLHTKTTSMTCCISLEFGILKRTRTYHRFDNSIMDLRAGPSSHQPASGRQATQIIFRDGWYVTEAHAGRSPICISR